MKSRAARLTLLILFIVSLGATAYLFWQGESLARSEAAALRAFDEKSRVVTRSLLDTRAAQQAYVAEGQAGEFWPGKVAEGISAIKGAIAALRDSARSAEAKGELDAALGKLDDFAAVDRRAREHTRTGQKLLASDLVFEDALEITGAIDARVEQARTLELAAANAAVTTFRNRQIFALAAGAAAATLIVLLLLPAGEPVSTVAYSAASADRAAQPAFASRSMAVDDNELLEEAPDLPIETDAWARPAHAGSGGITEGADEIGSTAAASLTTPEPEPEPRPAHEAAPGPVPVVVEHQAPATDLRGLASLCTDLARVIDTHELPSLLDRASTVLDARGIIVWIADPDGRELNPIVAHGYPAQLVNRLGTIDRDSENATAAAFRTSLVQTVRGDAQSNGAIAAPLVTPGGCVGVMAAELRGDGVTEESRVAAATILAAQLATLVGPPIRTHNQVEAANA